MKVILSSILVSLLCLKNESSPDMEPLTQQTFCFSPMFLVETTNYDDANNVNASMNVTHQHYVFTWLQSHIYIYGYTLASKRIVCAKLENKSLTL